MDSDKVPYPKFFLFKEHLVYFIWGKSYSVIEAVQNVKFEELMGIGLVTTFVNKMSYYPTCRMNVFDVGLVVSEAWFPLYRRSHPLLSAIHTLS